MSTAQPSPIFGPLAYVHTTYRDTVHIGDDVGDLGDLFLVEECLYYDTSESCVLRCGLPSQRALASRWMPGLFPEQTS